MKLKLRKSQGRMFTICDFTCTMLRGCSHGCVYGWCRFLTKSRAFSKAVDFAKLEDLDVRDCTIFVNSAHDTFCKAYNGWDISYREGGVTGGRKERIVKTETDMPKEWIGEMLTWMERQHPSITWMHVTKNPPGYFGWLKELTEMKARTLLGTTIETNRSTSTISFAPPTEIRAWAMGKMKALGFRLMVSIEPMLRFDVDKMADWMVKLKPMLVEIGLDSWASRHKQNLPQPRKEDYLQLKKRLEKAEITIMEKDSILRWLNT